MTDRRTALPLLQCRNGSDWNARKVLSRSSSAPWGGPPGFGQWVKLSPPPFVMHFTPAGLIVQQVFLNRCMYLLVRSSSLEFNTSAYTPVVRVLSVLCLLFPLFEDPGFHLNDFSTCSCRLVVWNMPSGPFTFCESGVTRAVLPILISHHLVSPMKYLLHEAHCEAHFILITWRKRVRTMPVVFHVILKQLYLVALFSCWAQRSFTTISRAHNPAWGVSGFRK